MLGSSLFELFVGDVSVSGWNFTKLLLPPSLLIFFPSLFLESLLTPLSLSPLISIYFAFAESRWCRQCHFHLPVCPSGCRPTTLKQLVRPRRKRSRKTGGCGEKSYFKLAHTHTHTHWRNEFNGLHPVGRSQIAAHIASNHSLVYLW